LTDPLLRLDPKARPGRASDSMDKVHFRFRINYMYFNNHRLLAEC